MYEQMDEVNKSDISIYKVLNMSEGNVTERCLHALLCSLKHNVPLQNINCCIPSEHALYLLHIQQCCFHSFSPSVVSI